MADGSRGGGGLFRYLKYALPPQYPGDTPTTRYGYEYRGFRFFSAINVARVDFPSVSRRRTSIIKRAHNCHTSSLYECILELDRKLAVINTIIREIRCIGGR